eukprot:218657_1
MTSTIPLTERINNIVTFDEAIPFLKALSVDIIKIFLNKSAKYGFFDKLSFDDTPANVVDKVIENKNDINDDETKQQLQKTQITEQPNTCVVPTRSEYSFKLNKTNKRVFDVIQYGTTLKGNFKKDYKYESNHFKNNIKLYQFGTIIFGKFFQKPTKLLIHMKLTKNCVNNAIGFGFISMKYNQFVDQTFNKGNNHSVMLYGDGRYYTSHEFVNDLYQHDTILKQFVNYFKNGETIAIELDMKSKQSIGKIYNIKETEHDSKHFMVSLLTSTNAIAICCNVKFKPSMCVVKQIVE